MVNSENSIPSLVRRTEHRVFTVRGFNAFRRVGDGGDTHASRTIGDMAHLGKSAVDLNELMYDSTMRKMVIYPDVSADDTINFVPAGFPTLTLDDVLDCLTFFARMLKSVPTKVWDHHF